ncbi:sensor histidine kinase [Pseudomonadota bacterium]
MTSKPSKNHFEAALALTIHDVKNSLALFLDRVEALQARDEIAGKKYADFKYEIKRINNNLIRLLALYKVGAENFSLQSDFYYIDDFLTEIGAEYAAVLKDKGIELIIECSDGLNASLDKGLVHGVLDNALNNAARYTQSKIVLKAVQKDGFLILSVQDDGPGYPEQMLVKNQQQMDCNTDIDVSNSTTGLGIFFSQIVAGLHQANGDAGFIKMTNQGDLGGSSFSIHLPSEEALNIEL